MKKFDLISAKNLETKNIFQAIIVIFLAMLFIISIFTVKEYFGQELYKENQINQRDIYAPFDYSFVDQSGQKIEVKQNELIVQRGKKITKTQESALNELNDLKKQPRKIYYLFGIFLQLIIFSIITATYLTISAPKVIFERKNIILLCLLVIFTIIGAKAISMANWPIYLIPLASISMLAAILIDARVSIILTLILSIFIGEITGVKFDLATTMLAGGIVSIYAVLNVRRRRDLTKAGLLIGLTNMVSIIAIELLNFVPLTEVILTGAWGLVNGFISAIIVTGILPIFEYLFQISTNISLLELSDLNQPLLKELVLKAPGTYHHSLVVGNLAESAAEAVGANSLLARVGSYFHDIGKIRMASYFSENESHSVDRHENLSPTISSLLIMNHIKEGADLARKYKLGKAIIDIITQHHGDDLVLYFYHRALETHDEETGKLRAENFRYPGPRPQTKEAAIVMLADSVEAASRALQQPSPAKIQELVKRIINNKFIDGQLDGCDLTLNDLHIIYEVFTHILSGIFHTRVEYPNLFANENEQNKNKEPSEKNKNQPEKNQKSGEQSS